MIDGDDIINIAVETGYRISVCETEKAKRDWKRTFSVKNCPNSHYKTFYASQNGIIKLENTISRQDGKELSGDEEKMEEEVFFQVQFRKFSVAVDYKEKKSSPHSVPEARPVNQHWDKMSLIPHRPGEVFFLLGVSKTLFYSAFPGECSPLAKSPLTAYVKRRNPGFSYGTPVVEVVQHNTRITSVEVSPKTGQFLATGDEDGFVKVMMLIRPRHLARTIDSRNTHELNFMSKSLEEQGNGVRMHQGPIFSMCWLESMNFEEKAVDELKEMIGEEDDARQSYLATGSADRCVKIWKIYWDRQGIIVSPLATLDTLTSHVLCLSSTVLINRQFPANESMQRIYLNSPGMKYQHRLSNESPALEGKHAHQDPAVSYTQVLVGSTNLGTVYVWRVHPYELRVHPEFSSNVDSGRHLIAIVHSSDTPIVHAEVTLARIANESASIASRGSDMHLVLTTSDTSGTVCIHSAPYYVTSDAELTTLPESMLSESIKAQKTLSMFSQGSRNTPITPATMSTPSRRFREHTQAMNSFTEWDECGEDLPDLIMFSLCGQAQYKSPVVYCHFEEKADKCGNSCTLDCYYADTDENPYKYRQVTGVKGLSIEVPSDRIEMTHKKHQMDDLEAGTLSLNLAFLDDSSRKVNVTEMLILQQKRISSTSREAPGNDISNNNKMKNNMPLIIENPAERYRLLEKEEDEVCFDEPRDNSSLPLPTPPADERTVKHALKKESTVESETPPLFGTVCNDDARSEDSSDKISNVHDSSRSNHDDIPHTIQLSPTPPPSPAKPPATPGVRFAEHEDVVVEKQNSDEIDRLLARQKKMEMKYPQSDLSVPSVNSSRALVERLQNSYDHDRDGDESSVTTCSTDRHFLANQAVNSDKDSLMYHDLPSLSDAELKSRLPKPVKLRPQIDRKWKKRQKETEPPPDSGKMFEMSDVVVDFKVKLPANEVKEKAVLENPELKVDQDLDTMKDKFYLHVPLDSIFGPMHETMLSRASDYAEFIDKNCQDFDMGVEKIHFGEF